MHWGRVCLFALGFKATEFVCMRSLRAKSEFPGGSVVRAVVCRGELVVECEANADFVCVYCPSCIGVCYSFLASVRSGNGLLL